VAENRESILTRHRCVNVLVGCDVGKMKSMLESCEQSSHRVSRRGSFVAVPGSCCVDTHYGTCKRSILDRTSGQRGLGVATCRRES
jgi:hypothetical protein